MLQHQNNSKKTSLRDIFWELLNLKKSDILDEGILFTNNKRSEDRFIVKWTPALRQIIEEIIKIHPQRVGDSPLFFGRGFKAYINKERKRALQRDR